MVIDLNDVCFWGFIFSFVLAAYNQIVNQIGVRNMCGILALMFWIAFFITLN